MARPVSKSKKSSTSRKTRSSRSRSSAGVRTARTKQVKTPEYIEIKIDESVVKLVGILVLGILGIVALLVYGNRKPANTGSVEIQQAQEQESTVTSYIGDSPVLGSKDAKVVIFEYGDYECPFCRRHDVQTFPQIKKEYIDTGKVKYVAKNFIAVPSHKPSALPAAYASMCVYEVAGNEKFWEFREKLVEAFEKGKYGIPADASKRLASEDAVKNGLRELAKDLGVNMRKYDKCISNTNELEKRFNEDQNYVMNKIAPKISGGVGTPMFVVCKAPKNNKAECKGEVIMGAYPFDTFKQAIDSLLKE